jgi:hypothetical protein
MGLSFFRRTAKFPETFEPAKALTFAAGLLAPAESSLTVTVNLAPGIYSLDVQAEDNDGLFGPSAALTLTVQLGVAHKRGKLERNGW